MSHYSRLKTLERKRNVATIIPDSVIREVEETVCESLKDVPPLPENRLEECMTVKEIEAEIERIIIGGERL